ncbi:MAG: M23 family metallopeptidase [Anaerolineales bacterium]|nr:M23 family metallopeptidase [Anaerolineales bacterium]
MPKLNQFILVFLLISMTSCSPMVENIVPTPGLTAAIKLTQTSEPSPVPTQGTTDSVQAATPTQTLAAPTLPAPRSTRCSPLAEHSLAQLPEIVSQPYAPPPPGKDERHHGVDFAYYNHAGRAAIDGEGVQAIMGGRVAAAIQDRLPYGNMVIIETPYESLPQEILESMQIAEENSVYHLYAHFAETSLVVLNQQVECGQLLGYVGQTGYVVPVAHLHLETRIGPPGVAFESMAFFDTQATPEEQAAYTRWRTSGDFQHIDPMTLFAANQGQ